VASNAARPARIAGIPGLLQATGLGEAEPFAPSFRRTVAMTAMIHAAALPSLPRTASTEAEARGFRRERFGACYPVEERLERLEEVAWSENVASWLDRGTGRQLTSKHENDD
jgi:hypothetical protein